MGLDKAESFIDCEIGSFHGSVIGANHSQLSYTSDGAAWPVAAANLPVVLPNIDDYTPVESSDPQPLLGKATDWTETTAGEAGVDPSLLSADTPVRRETNTMPGWAGSCWYFLRYCDPNNDTALIDPDIEQYWMGPTDELRRWC